MYHGISIGQSVSRGWEFVLGHRARLVRMAALPAALWFMLELLQVAVPGEPVVLSSFGGLVLSLFAIDWFRFVLGHSGGQSGGPAIDPAGMVRRTVRVSLRVGAVVILVSLILLPPTLVMAAGVIAFAGAPMTDQAIVTAVGKAMPVAMVLVSPLLVRFYAYYAVVAAGRRDLRLADIWRWAQGKSLGLLAVVALALAPGLMMITGASALGGGVLSLAGYAFAAPVLFISVAVMATVTARAMSGLIVPPVSEQS